MSDILWITGGRVVDPANGRDEVGDIFAINGVLSEALSDDQKEFARKIDATGLIVAPGLVDIHVHLRDPGQTHKESIRTGTQAAAAGGFTSIVCMPNTNPVCDNAGAIQRILDKVARDAVVNVYPTGCITLGMAGKQLAPTGQLKKAGIVALTDNDRCVQSNEIMRRAVEYARMFDLIVMDHCEDETQTRGAVMNEGEWSLRLGLKGSPKIAEDIMVARNVQLAELIDAHIHIQHVSSANALDIIRRAKERGVPITAEACPHHFTFTDAELHGYNTDFKTSPPLRTELDRKAVIEALRDGTLDCIASSHAPHTKTEKDCEFDLAPAGIIGLETSLAASLQTLYHDENFSLSDLVALMTYKAAAICKLDAGTLSIGASADICLFDPDSKWMVGANTFFSKSSNCPWHGKTLKGAVKATYIAGKLVFDGASITA